MKLSQPRRKLKVAIIGGGISSIAQACRLKETLGDQVEYTIYERNTDLGGVWLNSLWKGCAVDIPIHLYCLYSELNPWFKSKWAGRDEVLAYWNGIVDKRRIRHHFIFNTTFISSSWDSLAQHHLITFRRSNGDEFTVTADVLISATGALNKPIIPNLPGKEKFKGEQWHSSSWREDLKFEGKKIAVIGNGSSGIQCIPYLASLPGVQLTQFIRSPGYFRSKDNFDYSWFKRLVFRFVPGALRLYRWWLFYEYDRAILSRGLGTFSTLLRSSMTNTVVNYMKSRSPEKYWKDIIPDYPMHCKRVAYNAGWLEALNLPNVHLTSSRITELDESGLSTADGQHYEFDYICWATGFEVTETGVGLNRGVKGEEGQELKEIWKAKGGGYGYLGIAAPKIPNYFIVLGPNSIAMSWGYTLGHNTEFIARILKSMLDHNLSSVVVKDSAMEEYNNYLNKRLQSTALALPECGPRTWYKDPETGKLVAPAPWTATELWTRTRKIKFEDWKACRIEGDKVVVVDLKSPRRWTPIDWFASRLQSYLIGLMDDK
ncbi:flavin-containing monooxygenase [Sporobolomyces salmoneus]|uniref:flavin-containing monooxygenase n=1 Tax=Sporobolomyces salmoneus TaxID=183962 RepID=UPI00317EA7FF